MPQKSHAFDLRVLIFKRECRHLLQAAPIDNMHLTRAKTHSCIGRINRGISRADHGYSLGNRRNLRALVRSDKIERIGYAEQLLSCNPQSVSRAEPNAKKYGIVRRLQLVKLFRIDHLVEMKLHSKLRKHVNFAQALSKRQLVLCYSICIKPARQRP